MQSSPTFTALINAASEAKEAGVNKVKISDVDKISKAMPGGDSSKVKKQKGESVGGSSCHQCKSRRMNNDLTYCTSNLDKKKKSCRKKYCEHCLKKFYKESPLQIANKKEWKCPSCRKICCCAACRRKEMKGKGGKSMLPPALAAVAGLKAPVSFLLPPSADQRNNTKGGSEPEKSALGDSSVVPMEITSSDGHSPGINATSSPMSKSMSAQAMSSYISAQSQNHCFALLYAVANLPNVNKHIQYYLSRKDITDGQKVESIANLLRALAPKSSE